MPAPGIDAPDNRAHLDEANTHLSALVDAVVGGEDVVIAKAGKPMVRLVAIAPAVGDQRRFGLCRGRIRAADDFDAPLPDALLAAFEGPAEQVPK